MRKQEKPQYLAEGATCEVCGVHIEPSDIHSIMVNYAMAGKYISPYNDSVVGITAHQCLNLQHVGCCHAHAVEAAMYCMLYHYDLYEKEGDMNPAIVGVKAALANHHTPDDNYSHRATHNKMLEQLKNVREKQG